MAIWVDLDGHIVYANASACKRLGYDREELLDSRIFAIMADFPMENLSELVENIRESKAMRFEVDHQTKAGEVFPAEVRVTHLMVGGQELLCALVMDITERKSAELRVLNLFSIQKRREYRLRDLIQKARNGVVPVMELKALLEDH